MLFRSQSRKYKKRLEYVEANFEKEADKRLESILIRLELLKKKKSNIGNNVEKEVNSRLSSLISNIDNIETIRRSNEYYGAFGELAVIEELNKLSSEYYLFNDLRLELDHYIHFDGSKLRTAQIDHLVVGPTGVFVIETKYCGKNRSQELFTSSYTPYDQVRRASYIVYRILNKDRYGNPLQKALYNMKGKEISTRSIVAIVGNMCPFEPDRRIRLLSHDKLYYHIQKGNRSLSAEDVNSIVETLRWTVSSM